ncbi:MAG: hypothetical protein IBJ07_09620 [Rhizobiaceae bacterium]|nr:hypothetical protein [Rhizobiaceae bacterium]
MLRRTLLAIAIFCISTLASAQDRPVEEDPAGSWRQVSSSAGACLTCSITISKTSDGYLMTASNGWESRITHLRKGVFVGHGRWERSGPKLHPTREVMTVMKISVDGRMLLALALRRPDGTLWEINAEFVRRTESEPSKPELDL